MLVHVRIIQLEDLQRTTPEAGGSLRKQKQAIPGCRCTIKIGGSRIVGNLRACKAGGLVALVSAPSEAQMELGWEVDDGNGRSVVPLSAEKCTSPQEVALTRFWTGNCLRTPRIKSEERKRGGKEDSAKS